MSTQVMEKADGILSKVEVPDRHTYFQIEKFMVGKEPTAQAQMWAIVRELQARRDTVTAFDRDLADSEDNLELLDVKVERLNLRIRNGEGDPGGLLDIQECEINIRKLLREKESLVKAARSVAAKRNGLLEEMDFLLKCYDKLVSQFGEPKPFDDEALQGEMWNERLLEDLNLRMVLQRPLDPEFVKTVLCLNESAPVRRQVVSLIEQIQRRAIAQQKPAAAIPQIETRARTVVK